MKTDLIIITAIVVAGFLIYFAFVYGRIASIKVKITAVEKQIELDAGGKAK